MLKAALRACCSTSSQSGWCNSHPFLCLSHPIWKQKQKNHNPPYLIILVNTAYNPITTLENTNNKDKVTCILLKMTISKTSLPEKTDKLSCYWRSYHLAALVAPLPITNLLTSGVQWGLTDIVQYQHIRCVMVAIMFTLKNLRAVHYSWCYNEPSWQNNSIHWYILQHSIPWLTMLLCYQPASLTTPSSPPTTQAASTSPPV